MKLLKCPSATIFGLAFWLLCVANTRYRYRNDNHHHPSHFANTVINNSPILYSLSSFLVLLCVGLRSYGCTTVTSLRRPRLCRLAVFSTKPTLLPEHRTLLNHGGARLATEGGVTGGLCPKLARRSTQNTKLLNVVETSKLQT